DWKWPALWGRGAIVLRTAAAQCRYDNALSKSTVYRLWSTSTFGRIASRVAHRPRAASARGRCVFVLRLMLLLSENHSSLGQSSLCRRRKSHAGLDHTRGTEHDGIVPRAANQLKAQGEPVGTQAGRHADRRPAERIKRTGEVGPANAVQRRRRIWLGRSAEQIDPVEQGITLAAQGSASLLGAYECARAVGECRDNTLAHKFTIVA